MQRTNQPTNQPSQTTIAISKLIDKPTWEIESFLQAFREVYQRRKEPTTNPNNELYNFYKGWLPLVVDEAVNGDVNASLFDIFITYQNLGSEDFITLLISAIAPRDFNRLTKAIASI